MTNVKIILLGVSLIFMACLSLLAKETGEIQGKVVDETGEALPGVEISLQSPHLQGTRNFISSKEGEFRFPLLPVGTYTLNFKLKGFTPVIQEEVIVHLGRITHLKVTMKPSKIKEEIVVSAPSPLVDKASSDTSFYLSSEDLETLPVEKRNVVDAIKFTPGVTGVRINTRQGTSAQGQPSFRGEGAEGNNWIVDGLSVRGVRLRNSGLPLNFDSIAEIQVISDPFSPEYGPAYGGIVNMVTKSGSNDFSGEFSLVFTDKNLQASPKDQLSVVSEPYYFSDYTLFFNLGGALVKDKLWFFISNNLFLDTVETQDKSIDYFYIPGGKKSAQNNNLFTKFTYTLNSNHNLSLTSTWHKSLGQTGGIGVPELYQNKHFTDSMLRLNYKGILNNSTLMEAGLGVLTRDSLQEPDDEDLGPAMYYIEDLARNIHNSYGSITDDQKRLDFSLKLTKYLETDNFGQHEFNLGLEYYYFSSVFKVDFTGKKEDLFPQNGFDSGTKYYFSSWEEGRRTPTFFYEYGEFNFINSSRGVGIYAVDKITWNRVTFMAGIRSQTQLCLDNRGKKLWAWDLHDFLSPRFSFSLDLTGNGVNILKIGWGRFSDLISTMPLGLLNSGAGLNFRTYRWIGPVHPLKNQLHNPSNWEFENEQKSQPFEIASGISPNFLTRYLVEFDRRLGKDWVFKTRYVRSRAKNLLEVLAVFDPETQYKFLFDNFEYKRRNYQGLEFELNGKIGSSFYFNASYTYASAKGTNPGQTETGAWAQEEGNTNYIGLFGNHIYVPDVPQYKEVKEYVDWALHGLGGRGIGDEGWYGKLPYSVDHNLKINGVLFAPYGFTISSALEWVSGYYWEKRGYVPFYGGYYSFPEGRGSRKTPPHFYLDMGVEKEIKFHSLRLPSHFSVVVRMDILNLLNSQKPISYVRQDIPLFGEVWGRQQPRQARLMVKLEW